MELSYLLKYYNWIKIIVSGCLFLFAFSGQGQDVNELHRLDNAGSDGSLFINSVLNDPEEKVKRSPF